MTNWLESSKPSSKWRSETHPSGNSCGQKTRTALKWRALRFCTESASIEADPGWRIVAAASVAAIYRTLPRGAQPSGQRQSDLVSFAAEGQEEHRSSAVSRTTGRPAEVLREGSGIKVEGTAGDGLTISTYIKG